MSVFCFFENLSDPRAYNQKHHFLDIVFLVVSAVISGANSWTEIKLFGELHLDWLRKYRPFECGIPVDDTIAHVIKHIEPQAFNEVFLNFINEIRTQQGREVIAIDGKTLRHSFNPETQSALHSVTVWSQSRGLILSQKKSSGKQNEQQTVMEIIDSFCLKNAVITVDAMNTQKKIAEKIIEKKGDYVMPLKKNHRQFQSEVEAYFHKISRDCPEMFETFKEVNAERRRIDERYYRKLKVSDWLSKAEEWKGIKSVLEVCRKR
ncbi:ISAs1 family transposase, partial [Glaesserella parasuis]|nr:ISAs1 family transposase [Glaesserella parasuis]